MAKTIYFLQSGCGQVLRLRRTANHRTRRAANRRTVGERLLLYDSLGIYYPDPAVGILVILKSAAQLRLLGGGGGGRGLLQASGSIYQVGDSVKLGSRVFLVGSRFLPFSVEIKGVVVEAVIALSLAAPSVWKNQLSFSPVSSL